MQFAQLPAELHVVLSKYLSAADLAVLSQVSNSCRDTYRPLSWSKTYVLVDGKRNSLIRSDVAPYLNDPSYRILPVEILNKPCRYSRWFPAGLINTITWDDFVSKNFDVAFSHEQIEQYFSGIRQVNIMNTYADTEGTTLAPVSDSQRFDNIYTFLKQLPNLQKFSFASKLNPDVLSSFDSISTLPQLTSLKVPISGISETSCGELPFIPNVTTLELTSPGVGSYKKYKAIVGSIKLKVPKLKSLSLAFIMLSEEEDYNFGALYLLPHGLKACELFISLRTDLLTFDNSDSLTNIELPQLTRISFIGKYGAMENLILSKLSLPNVVELFQYRSCNDTIYRGTFGALRACDSSILTKLHIHFNNIGVAFLFLLLSQGDSFPNMKTFWVYFNFCNRSAKIPAESLELVDELQVEIIQHLATATNHLDVIKRAMESIGGDHTEIKKILKELEPDYPRDVKFRKVESDGTGSPYYISHGRILEMILFPLATYNSNPNLYGEPIGTPDSDEFIDMKLTVLYACMEAFYSKILAMPKLETVFIDSAFSIDYSPSFHLLIESHKTLKSLFISEHEEKFLPSIANPHEFISKSRPLPEINKDYLKYTSQVYVTEVPVYSSLDSPLYLSHIYDSMTLFGKGRHDYENDGIYIPFMEHMDYLNRSYNATSYVIYKPDMKGYFGTLNTKGYPKTMFRVDVEGMRNHHTRQLSSQNVSDYYFDRDEMRVSTIYERYKGKERVTKPNVFGLQEPKSYADETMVKNHNDISNESKVPVIIDRIHKYPHVSLAFKDQFLNEEENRELFEQFDNWTSHNRKDFNMGSAINIHTIDTFGV